jgi:hypothetical protein
MPAFGRLVPDNRKFAWLLNGCFENQDLVKPETVCGIRLQLLHFSFPPLAHGLQSRIPLMLDSSQHRD